MTEERERHLDERERRLDERERRLDEREARSERRLAEQRLLAARERRDDGGEGEAYVEQREWSDVTHRVPIDTADGIFYLCLDPFMTVDALKAKIERIVGIPKADQRLEVDDTCLDDAAATLQSCGVDREATLHLTDLVPQSRFPLSMRSLTGKIYQVNAAGHMRITRVKFLVWLSSGIPPDQQRVIFDGRQLHDDRTVADYGLSPDSKVHLVLRLRGDIGVWGAAENGPGAEVLRGAAPPTPAACAEVRAALLVGPLAAANPPAPAAMADPLLDAQQCDALCRAADAAINTAENASATVGGEAVSLDGAAVKVLLRRTPGVKGAATDWQVELASHTITARVGVAAVAGLKSALGAAAHRFVVRRVDAGAGVEAIPFHTDYARRTLQVPLNAPLAARDGSGYVGGEVVYAVEGGFLKLPRRRGYGVVHDGAVPHGVTPLVRGRRYGLCVLHDPNDTE
jgi:hypothetical protein